MYNKIFHLTCNKCKTIIHSTCCDPPIQPCPVTDCDGKMCVETDAYEAEIKLGWEAEQKQLERDWKAEQARLDREWKEKQQEKLWNRHDNLKKEMDVEEKTSLKWVIGKIQTIVIVIAPIIGGWFAGNQAGDEAARPLKKKVWHLERAPSAVREVAKEELRDKIKKAKENGGVVEVNDEEMNRIREKAMDKLRAEGKERFKAAFEPDRDLPDLNDRSMEQQIQMPLEGVRVIKKK